LEAISCRGGKVLVQVTNFSQQGTGAVVKHLQRPECWRWMTLAEVRRLHGVPDSYYLGEESKTTAGEILGQGVIVSFFQKIIAAGEPALKGLFQIEPGERTIFPIRAHLPSLADVMFVLCEFTLQQKRVPAAYRGFYVKSRPAHLQNEDDPTHSVSKSPLNAVADSLEI
jgi:hypothetical protein